MVNAHDDHGRDLEAPDQMVHRLVHVPLAGIAGGIVEQVLGIVHVKHGIRPMCVAWRSVIGGQPHPQHPRVMEDLALEGNDLQHAEHGMLFLDGCVVPR